MDLEDITELFRWNVSNCDDSDCDDDRVYADVLVLTGDGEIHRPLSLSWDRDNNCWMLVCEFDTEEA